MMVWFTPRCTVATLVALLLALVSMSLITGEAHAKRTNADVQRPAAQRSILQIKVNVDSQTMDVHVGGRLAHRWPVSTGRDGFETPGGVYRPQRLERDWYSRQYDDAPMPYSVFFSGGYAIHGTTETRRLGQPASHGCIRLSARNAAKLFALVESHGYRRTRIEIED